MESFFLNFSKIVHERPDHPAIAEYNTAWTYSELDRVVDGIARRVASLSVPTGGLVGFLGRSLALRTAAFAGIIKAGQGIVVLNPKNTVDVLAGTVEHAGLDAILVDCPEMEAVAQSLGCPVASIADVAENLESIQEFVPVPTDPQNIAYIVYTSGSTGNPKGVAITRAALEHETELEVRVSKIDGSDRPALFGQLWPETFFACFTVGASYECYNFGTRGAIPLAEWINEKQITFIAAYPAMFRALAAATEETLPTVKRFYLIGEPLRRADAEAFERLCLPGSEILNLYGSSEYPVMAGFTFKHGDPKPWETMPMGESVEEGTLRLLDDDGREVIQGETGQIVYTAPHVPRAYHRETERSKVTFRPVAGRPDLMAYYTGDYAVRGFDGILQTAGRTDDQVKVWGYTIRLSDIEQVLIDHPAVKQAVVAGYPGAYGMQLAGHIVPADGEVLDEAALRQYLRGKMPGYMVPGMFVRHDALPTTGTGKISRRLLPTPIDEQSGNQRGLNAARGETEKAVAAIWLDVLGHADFGRHDDFFDVGGDSLQAMAFLLAAEKRFDVRIPLEMLILEGASIASLAAQVSARAERGDDSSLVALGRTGSSQPLFAAHVVGGHLSDYLELAHTLDGVRPMLGISPRGMYLDDQPDADMSDIAEHGANVIRQEAPAGPHNLIGYSAGGTFALEMARVLVDEGQDAPALVLLDSQCEWLDRLRWTRHAWQTAKKGNASAGARRFVGGVAATLGKVVQPDSIDDAHMHALLSHRPEPLFLPRSLLVTSDEGLTNQADWDEWRRILGPGLEIIKVGGDHMGMIRGGNAKVLAMHLEEWLAQGEQERAAPANAEAQELSLA